MSARDHWVKCQIGPIVGSLGFCSLWNRDIKRIKELSRERGRLRGSEKRGVRRLRKYWSCEE